MKEMCSVCIKLYSFRESDQNQFENHNNSGDLHVHGYKKNIRISG